MARALWTGALSFGLVHVPVKLVTAVREKSVHFNLLSEDGHCRLRRKLYCPETGQEYDFNQTARGYEVAPDQYLIIRDDELEKLKPEAGRTVEITDFVPLASIDPIFFDRVYYLLPGEGGAKGYALLVEAMQQTSKVGIAHFVMREREHLVALRVAGDMLVVHTMHYAEEVTQPAELSEEIKSPGKINPRELDVAGKLIEALSTEYDPMRYKDDYRERVEALIQAKSQGHEARAVSSDSVQNTPPTFNIMDALRESLEKTRQRRPEANTKSSKKSSSPRRRTPAKSKAKPQPRKSA